jgi:hypothetical protein
MLVWNGWLEKAKERQAEAYRRKVAQTSVCVTAQLDPLVIRTDLSLCHGIDKLKLIGHKKQ